MRSYWEQHFQVVKLTVEEHLTCLLADWGELLLFLNSAVISPWLLLWGRERWLFTCYYLLWATGESGSESILAAPHCLLGGGVTEHRVKWILWKGDMQPAHPSSPHGADVDADVTKWLISASLREAVGFCSPETGCKVLGHMGFPVTCLFLAATDSLKCIQVCIWIWDVKNQRKILIICSTRRGVESVNTCFRTGHMQSMLNWFWSTWKLVTILTDSKIDPSHLQDEKGAKSQNEGKKKTMCERKKGEKKNVLQNAYLM